MSSTYTTSLTLTQIGNGEQSGTWGTTTNTNWQLIEDSVAGVANITLSGTSSVTLTVANGASDQSRKAVIVATGATSGTCAVIAPLVPKVYIISNQTTGGNSITIGATTGSVVTIANGLTTLVYCDGTNFYSGITGFTGGNLNITGTINATGTITAPVINASLYGGVANSIPYQVGASATSYITAPSGPSTLFLSWIPGTGFQWQTSSTTASTVNGGSTNAILYQATPGNTQFITPPTGATPLALQWNGTNMYWGTSGAVTSVSGGSTGLTPNTPTVGAVVLAGTLNIANGGTGSSTQNFVDLSNTQTVGGAKTFTSLVTAQNFLSQAGSFNFNGSSSIALGGSTIQLAVSNSAVLNAQSSGTYNPTGVYGTISDIRIKENIVPARSYLSDLCKLNVVNYNLKNNPNKHLGFVAQDVETIMPGLVETAETINKEFNLEDMKSVKTSLLIPMLVQAIQELKAEIDTLKAK
jgi:hypothetical protein